MKQNFCHSCQKNIPLFLVDSKKTYIPLKCAYCGLVQTSPMPSDNELISFYQGFSFECNTPEVMRRPLTAITQSLKHFIGENDESNHSTKTFLDYGGGAGIYCIAAEAIGWKTTLFDYDQKTVDYGINELGVREGYADWNALKSRKFDVIFSFHVVEHWNEVENNFGNLIEKLNPGGRLIIATPNAHSIEKWFRPQHFLRYFRLWKPYMPSRWMRFKLLLKPDSVFCWDPPRHLFAWTPEAFRQLGKRFNLETTIKVGYNIDKHFEPRAYVLYPLKKRIKQVRSMKINLIRKILLAAWECISLPCIQLASRVAPHYGEQLYVEFEKVHD